MYSLLDEDAQWTEKGLRYLYELDYTIDTYNSSLAKDLEAHACMVFTASPLKIPSLHKVAITRCETALEALETYVIETGFAISFLVKFINAVDTIWLWRNLDSLRGCICAYLKNYIPRLIQMEDTIRSRAQAHFFMTTYQRIFREVKQKTPNFIELKKTVVAEYQFHLDAFQKDKWGTLPFCKEAKFNDIHSWKRGRAT